MKLQYVQNNPQTAIYNYDSWPLFNKVTSPISGGAYLQNHLDYSSVRGVLMKKCSCRAFYSVINKYPEDKHFDCFKTQNEKRIIKEMVYLDDYVLFYTTWICPLRNG